MNWIIGTLLVLFSGWKPGLVEGNAGPCQPA
jgi:hypothetical protein